MFTPKRKWELVLGFALFVLPVISAAAQAEVPTVCLIGDHPGIPESDAQTAALLVCDELRKHGISIAAPVYEAPASASVYRVVLRRLGEKIIVRLSQENPIGTIIAEQQLTLANIEEMIPAAPRLVNALVHSKPIDDTVDMENVTEQEARELRKISGESLWHLEIFGTFVPGTDIAAEPGYGWGWSYQTPSYAVGSDLRFAVNYEDDYTDDSDGFGYASWAIGGRYFLNKQNISPYVGGGLAIMLVGYERDYYDSEGDFGLGVYGVAGVEALRLTQSRLNLELRIDRPFFTLESQDIMPITVGISFSRNYNPGGCLF
ncbi:hypothetical protein C6502_04315 [Candidatus Poribacteria bacterium]|nr:MAG: hypothetical protein C6502_04315 [Candidatus Poribacteria bacterium]